MLQNLEVTLHSTELTIISELFPFPAAITLLHKRHARPP